MFKELLALSFQTSEIIRVDIESGETTPLEIKTGSCPDGIVVIDDTVYWTTMGEVPKAKKGEDTTLLKFKAQDGQVRSAPLAGGEVTDLTPVGEFTTGKQLVTDGNGNLYFSDREGYKVFTVRTDGSGLTELVVNDSADGDYAECVGCGVDTENGYLYWTQKGPGNGGGQILRAGLEIPEGKTADNRSDIEVLWDKLPEPIDIEIYDGYLYWTDRGHGESGNSVNRAPLPAKGETGEKPEVLADGFEDTIGLAIDEETGVIYAADLGGNIRAVAIPGKSEAKDRLVTKHTGMITGITGMK
ncbi:MAG: hypothetical protein QM571_05015 [Micrococcaceae bacterium]